MYRYAVVEGGEVKNVIMAPEGYRDPKDRELVPSPLGVGPEIGWVRENGEWVDPNAPEDEETDEAE